MNPAGCHITIPTMKLNDKLISSLDSLRVNFDFIEIWNKRDIAIRDFSPAHLYYPNSDKVACYEAFAHPENVSNENGMLILHGTHGNTPLSLDADNDLLSTFSATERIQISALHKLADVPVTENVGKAMVDNIPLTANEVVLNNGQSLNCSELKVGSCSLMHKAIIVPETSGKKSKVGEYYLAPGQMTYGVFCDGVLVDVVPPFATNTSFHLRYEMIDNEVTLIVIDNSTNNQVAKYRNAHYFALLGESDFIIINGLIVSSFNNEDLNNRLRQNIVKAKSPEIVSVDGDHIQIVYKDNTKETIQL